MWLVGGQEAGRADVLGAGGEAGRAGEKRTPAWLELLERGSEREILWGFCQF